MTDSERSDSGLADPGRHEDEVDREFAYPYGEFHARDGVFFSRADDEGSVRIRAWLTPSGGKEVLNIVLSESAWASVVASVSSLGEDAARWQAARDFHGGNRS